MANLNNLNEVLEAAPKSTSVPDQASPEVLSFHEETVVEVRDIILSPMEAIECVARIGTNYNINFLTSYDARQAVVLGLAFLNGWASARPGCSNEQEAQVLIICAASWLNREAPRFNRATDVTFNVWAADGVPRPATRSLEALELVEGYVQYRIEKALRALEAN